MINKYRKKGDLYILLKLKNLLIDYLVRTMMIGYKISNFNYLRFKILIYNLVGDSEGFRF